MHKVEMQPKKKELQGQWKTELLFCGRAIHVLVPMGCILCQNDYEIMTIPTYIMHMPTCIVHMPTCIVHMPTCIMHMPPCIMHMPTCIVHMPIHQHTLYIMHMPVYMHQQSGICQYSYILCIYASMRHNAYMHHE